MAKIVPASEFQQNVGAMLEEALAEPIVITHYGRERHVLCSHARYSEMWNAWKRERGELVEADEAVLEKAKS